jgi:hypothetical protein
MSDSVIFNVNGGFDFVVFWVAKNFFCSDGNNAEVVETSSEEDDEDSSTTKDGPFVDADEGIFLCLGAILPYCLVCICFIVVVLLLLLLLLLLFKGTGLG